MKTLIPIGTSLLCLVTVLAGCGKKPQATPAASEPLAVKAGTNQPPVLETLLTAWQQGQSDTAISNFVATDWSSRPLFAAGSVLNLSETEFKAQVGYPDVEKMDAAGKKMLSQIDMVKKLASAVTQAGTNAAAAGDYAKARQHFTALKHCGEALDSTNSLKLLQLVGQSMRKRADTQLANLPQ